MAQERKLTKIAVDAINDMKGVNLIGSSKAEDHEGIVTFTIDRYTHMMLLLYLIHSILQ